jgi:hypothetical protein
VVQVRAAVRCDATGELRPVVCCVDAVSRWRRSETRISQRMRENVSNVGPASVWPRRSKRMTSQDAGRVPPHSDILGDARATDAIVDKTAFSATTNKPRVGLLAPGSVSQLSTPKTADQKNI